MILLNNNCKILLIVVICFILPSVLTAKTFSKFTGDPIDIRPIMKAIDQNKNDDFISSLIDKSNDTAQKQPEEVQSMMKVYDKMVSKYGITKSYQKTYGQILFFLYLCLDADVIKKVFYETEKLNLLENNTDERNMKLEIYNFLSLMFPEEYAKFDGKLIDLSDKLVSSDIPQEQIRGFLMLARRNMNDDTSVAKKNLEAAKKLAVKINDNETLSQIMDVEKTIKDTESRKKSRIVSDDDSNKVETKIINLIIFSVVVILMIILIISKIRKYNNKSD